MDFPKFSREENLSTKLSDSDIIDIQYRISKKESQRSIAKIYGVSQSTIYYWSLTKEERQKLEKVKKLKQKESGNIKPYKEKKHYYLSYRERKKKLHPEIINYENENAKKYKKNPNSINVRKKAERKYYEKNREKIINRIKAYQLKNPEVHKKAMKKYREKLKRINL